MGIRKFGPSNFHLGMMREEPLDQVIYRIMSVFITSCWFQFTRFLFFVIKLIEQHVFRIKIKDVNSTAMKDCFQSLEPVPEDKDTEVEERYFDGFGEEEQFTSNFSFKFEYQIPEFNSIGKEEASSVMDTEGDFSAKTTGISNYQFLPKNDFCGFVVEPEALNFKVHESFISQGEENTEINFLSAKDFEKSCVESRDVRLSHDESCVGRIDKDVGLKCLSVEDSVKSFTESKDDMESEDEPSISTSEESRESKLSSEKYFKRSFTESEGFILSKDEPFIGRTEKILSAKDFRKSFKQLKQVLLSKDEFFINQSETNTNSVFLSAKEFRKASLVSEDRSLGEKKPVAFETKSLYEKESREGFSGFGSDSDSISSSDGYSVKNLAVDSDGFLSEKDFGDEESLMDSNTFEVELMEGIGNFDEGESSNSNAESSIRNSPNDFEYIYDGFLSNEDLHILQNSSAENHSPTERSVHSLSLLDETWSENDSGELELELKDLSAEEEGESPSGVLIEFMDSSDDELPSFRNSLSKMTTLELPDQNLEDNIPDTETKSDSTNAKHLSPIDGPNQVEKKASEEDLKKSHVEDLNDEELDELESLWEHQDLIEQLKMEIKRAKAVGLPTIFEESESPKMSEDLKPWKIDEKFLQEDPLDELHKFYRSYRERMRKFDILNYQKMYAMGFLQLKNPLQSIGSQKPLIPTILAHISQNLWPLYRRKSSTNASENFIKELQVELENVYVGQTCLSWEFLRWQYEKARELPESDPYRSHQYNQVAGDFQQFQVILQRFIENESFQGPRLPNYVKNRCVLRNLLQVPVIKEDCLKDKMEGKKKGNDAITSEMLEDIMEESIRIFWEFIKADKDDSSVILKGLIGNQVELQDSADYNLLADVQASLQKKEKRLKDILKTGNCLVKKFKKPREDRSNQDLFFSQVDMKLVSRVLKMSRITTDQLVWCHTKLNKIKVAERKIHREPSFLLFPC